MFEAFVPKITLPAGKESRRAGGGIGIKCNGEVMLVDGFEGGEPTNGLKDWLEKNGVSTVKTAVLTHIHYDHYHGLMEIEDDGRFHIETVLMYDPLTLKHGCDGSENGQALQDDIDRAYKFIRFMQAHGTKVKWIDKGSKVKCGDTSWNVYRNQPRHFTDDDDGNAYAFVNDGSLVLCSPEVPLLFGGDGCVDLEDAIAYFHQIIIAMYVLHHGNDCPESDAKAAKEAGVILMWETNVERKGAGTTGFTQYGSRRVVQQGIPVWMQNEPIYITAANGKITFKQGSKTVTAKIPYEGKCEKGWVKNQKGWWYRFSDGTWAVGWKKLKCAKDKKNGLWFYFGADGYMATGWQKVNGKWYYLDPAYGDMKTGWIFVNGIWYYLEDSGAMHTGWMDWKGKKCYLDPANGHCSVNCTRTIDGKTFRFDKGGYATEITGGAVIDRSKKFIDISEFQGDVDWSKAAGTVGAVYIRCGLRGSLKNTAPADYKLIRYDRKWTRNLAAVQKHGVPFSAYYFPTAINDAEALEGAKWFYEVVKDLNLAFPPALDSENVWGNGKEAGRANGLSKSERTRLLKIVTDYFNARGMNIGIYASASWLNSKIDMSAFPQCVRDCTWVADSTGAVDYSGYYWLHQYDQSACAGFSDDVDLNRITGTIPPVRTDGKRQEPQQDQRAAIVSEAISHVGVKEGTVLHHKIIDRYNSRKPLPRGYAVKYTDAWCATFISYLAIVMGYTDIIPVECGCPQMITLAKQMGIWVENDAYVPKPGDIALYDWQDSGAGDNTGTADHIGIVEKVVGSTETIIEGNYQDSVKRRELAVNGRYIRGYIVPKYK